jgi:small subunit ribosomal protein S8
MWKSQGIYTRFWNVPFMLSQAGIRRQDTWYKKGKLVKEHKMSITDPIADALTKIRNAYRASHKSVQVNHSNLTEAIVKILAEENFVNSYELIDRDPEKKIYRKQIYINLRYTNEGKPVLRGVERVSRPGRRLYVNSVNIPSVYNNTGCALLSTNNGVMVDREARKRKIGGEYICKVW